MNISIFAKPAFLNINPHEAFKDRVKPLTGHGHLMRVSSMIRGDQIANYLEAKLNPESGYENDVCIYVKPMVRKGDDFKFEGKPFLDIVDGHNLGLLAMQHPEVTVIVCSQADYNTMTRIIKNKVVLIPQHHCNFERFHRNKEEIKKVGIIGTVGAFPLIPEEIRAGLKKRNIELVEFSKFYNRLDIMKFYMDINVQLVWRPYRKLLSNPLKIVNAASYQIPTIALDEPAFQEVKGCYVPVNSPEEFLYELDNLKLDPEFDFSIAENYHIEKIAKLYQDLCTI
jgi:hypothetical protein